MRRGAAVLALVAGVWALAVWLGNGFTFVIAGHKISSFDPLRPLIVASVAAALYVWRTGLRQAQDEIARAAGLLTPARLAAVLSLTTVAVGLAGTSWAASGADAYGYVSHADLWLHGRLKIPMPIADRVPWPNGLETLTPFAYRGLPAESAIVPVTAPGVPMLMAVLKAVAGHCAVFWVAPLAGGLLVWTTFVLGRRLAVRGESPASIETGDAPGPPPHRANYARRGPRSQGATNEHIGPYVSEEQRREAAGSPTRVSQRVGVQEGCSAGRMPAEFHHGLLSRDAIGLGGAWLLATSPVFLIMLKSPMSDVPAAAFWTLATVGLLTRSAAGAAGAGLSASIAILMRPNLAPIAVAMAAWCAVRRIDLQGTRRLAHAGFFSIAVVPGCLAVAWFNASLYGSPFTSGYGDVNRLFSLGNVPTNLALFGSWLVETQTLAAAVGLLAILIPVRSLWKSAEAQRAAELLGIVTVVVWAVYCLYTPFDAWWYLRFLLPAWPAMSLGTAAVVIRLLEHRGRVLDPPLRLSQTWAGRAALGLLFGLGVYGVLATMRLGVFPQDEGDRRYVTVAEIVERATEPSSVIVTGQHIGSVRYYTGRLTLQFAALDQAWLDRAVEWLDRQGLHTYILLEDWERPLFEARFAGANALGRLDMQPVVAYRSSATSASIYLFDPRRPDGPTVWAPRVGGPRPRCVEPASPSELASR